MSNVRSLSLAAALGLAAPLVLSAAPAVAGEAEAGPSVTVTDAGDRVVVRARGVAAGDGAVSSRRSWLRIPLADSVTLLKRFSDPTIDKIEAVGGRSPYLGVRLRGDVELAASLAGVAAVREIDGGLEISIPRATPAPATPAALAAAPKVTAPAPAARALPVAAAAAAPVAAEAPAAPPPTAAAATTAAKPVDADEAPAAEPVAGKPAAALATAPAAPLTGRKADAAPVAGLKLATKESPPLGNLMMLVTLALTGLGGFLLWKKKHGKKAEVDGSILEVRASLPIGGRAKVIWVAAGSRELLLSVSEKDVHVLSQWQADGSAPTMPLLTGEIAPPANHQAAALAAAFAAPAGTLPPPIATTAPAAPIVVTPPRAPALVSLAGERPSVPTGRAAPRSPTVSGLLALRDRAPKASETTDPESDEEWSRMLLEATQRGAR